MTACLSDHKENNNRAAIRGDYFGQTLPGDTAKLFAPDIISTGMNERDFAISPDGNEIFFCREVGNFKYTTIIYTQRIDQSWTIPEVFEYCTNPEYKYIEPHLCLDRWSQPLNMGPKINSANPKEWSASVSPDGKYLFFMSARMENNTLDQLSQQSLNRFHNSPQNGNSDIYWISSSVIDELKLQARF